MEHRQRTGLAWGIILIGLGIFFLIIELFPNFGEQFFSSYGWPFLIIGAGGLLLLIGILTGAPGLAVPACIVGGIGMLLYWQNLTNNWESWAYAWLLIPGFSGAGVILMGLLMRRWSVIRGGIWTVLTSLTLFALAGSLFGNIDLLGRFWPLLIVLMGVLLLLQSLFRQRS